MPTCWIIAGPKRADKTNCRSSRAPALIVMHNFVQELSESSRSHALCGNAVKACPEQRRRARCAASHGLASCVYGTQRVTAIKLSLVGAGHARDERAASRQSPRKYRGHGPLLRFHYLLNLMAVTQRVGTRLSRRHLCITTSAPAWEPVVDASASRIARAMQTAFPRRSVGTMQAEAG